MLARVRLGFGQERPLTNNSVTYTGITLNRILKIG